MKVKDLIEKLSAIKNQEGEISFLMDDGCCGDFIELDPPYNIEEAVLKGYEPWTVIRFNAIEILSTCIGSGRAHRSVLEYRKGLGPNHPHFCSGCGHYHKICNCAKKQ